MATAWGRYFRELSLLLEEGERQYGIANRRYTDYILERLEFIRSACSELLHHLRHHTAGLEEYKSELTVLIECLRQIHHRWTEYGEVLDSYPSGLSYQVRTCVSSASGLGRPQFQISKDQLEYLSSLGFKWKEIAALLGVSRMTIYRQVHSNHVTSI